MTSPQRTAATPPLAVRIADDLRIRIEQGQLLPGDSLPTLSDLATTYGCSFGPARQAMTTLRGQGLIAGGRGKALIVRQQPRRVQRDAARHRVEKALVLAPENVRREHGLSEDDIGESFSDIEFRADLDRVPADQDLADAFGLPLGTELLRRVFTFRHRSTGQLEAWSLSWLPGDIVDANPAIADPGRQDWPGGTMHQLYTVGIEVADVQDLVTGAMPSTAEAVDWALPDATPMLWVRRISFDTTGRVVEISDAPYPSDRTILVFHTQLPSFAALAEEQS